MSSLIENAPESARALFDAESGQWIDYGRLREECGRIARTIDIGGKGLVFLHAGVNAESVAAYLACLEAGHAVALLDPGISEEFRLRLWDLYRPDFVFAPPQAAPRDETWRSMGTVEGPLRLWGAASRDDRPIHPDLAVLLSTSGSTGSPKLVRLSRRALMVNTEGIRERLAIGAEDRPISSLPFHYSYGMSVLNSHLLAGASIALSGEGLTSGAFWEVFRQTNCTSFAGVPYTYQMLARLDIDKLNIPSLTTLTQAGGKLHDHFILAFQQQIARRGGRFFVMYGQTEAAPRIATLPANYLPEKVGSSGFPMPGGEIEIVADGVPTIEPGVNGEIVYRGPNVMMGYATGPQDLALGDTEGGRLKTGDLGYLDDDGLLYITGRLKRIAKVFGLRLSLDEVEDLLKGFGPAAAVEADDGLAIFCEFGDDAEFGRLKKLLADKLKLHATAFRFRRIDVLPLNANGKIDYQKLEKQG